MLNHLFSRFSQNITANNREQRLRRLAMQELEPRTMFAGIPQLSSLPGAAHTLYLDFDGHFQATWNRTDSNQTYTNVNVGEFNLDGEAGISTSEAAAIQKIWETVADDFAPFNVNVTTVAPLSFGNNSALRVVIGGTSTATLRTSAGTTINIPSRDVFISNDDGTMVDTSGYAAINSYTNAEPNVVYVFAKYMSTWGNVDSEGHSRDLRAMIATTASHEAGHAYGLVHHGDYDLGTSITTPIMGSNTQGDRSIWSLYSSGNTTFDTKARLTTLFGVRPDEFTGSLSTATEFPIGYSPLRGYSGSVNGVIGTTQDQDLFRLTITSLNTYQITVTVPQFGNLDSQLVLYVIRGTGFGPEYLEPFLTIDPPISSLTPFAGLGATLQGQLPIGKYAVAVRSHGGYGDIGGYTLTVSIPSSGIYYNPGTLGYFATTTTSNPTPTLTSTFYAPAMAVVATREDIELKYPVATTQSTSAVSTRTTTAKKTSKPTSTAAYDEIFENWPSETRGMLII